MAKSIKHDLDEQTPAAIQEETSTSKRSKKGDKPRDKVKTIFEGMDELNPWGATLSESALSVVDEWTDTGSYALNSIISGSC
ncbi:MAG: hypothetical protein WC905_00790, partial [Patescibacteria group bacterium]